MENAQHHKPLAVYPVLEHVRGINDLQYDLPIFLAPFDRAPKQRMLRQNLGFSIISSATIFARDGWRC
jgi:hypothetical protein